MSDVRIQVDLLIETLRKKKKLLEEIHTYTEEQRQVLNKDSFNPQEFQNIMTNKQVRIDLLSGLDDGFEATFERVKSTLSHQPVIYNEEIRQMQALIQEVNDIGIEIQVQEERNRRNFEAKIGGVRSEAKSFRSHKTAMKQYRTTYNQKQKPEGPHFFDSKK